VTGYKRNEILESVYIRINARQNSFVSSRILPCTGQQENLYN